MTGRTIPEWIGATPDAAIPRRVRLRVFQATDGCCYKCSVRLTAGRWDVDHITPLWDGGKHAEGNLGAACDGCHTSKSKEEASQRAEARRHQMKLAGIPQKKRKIPYRKFDGTPVWPE